jgi:hypothetical protein
MRGSQRFTRILSIRQSFRRKLNRFKCLQLEKIFSHALVLIGMAAISALKVKELDASPLP